MNWQTWVASFVVFLAAVWIGGRIWKFFRAGLHGEPAGSCGSCGKGRDGVKKTNLVELSPPSRDRP